MSSVAIRELMFNFAQNLNSMASNMNSNRRVEPAADANDAEAQVQQVNSPGNQTSVFCFQFVMYIVGFFLLVFIFLHEILTGGQLIQNNNNATFFNKTV